MREQVAQLERLSRMKRFFSRAVAEAIVAGGEELLEPHRREITAVFLDLRGFTAFTDRADPDEVLELLRAYHATLGRTVDEFGGTLEHFAGDGVMIFFNDPIEVDKPAERAIRMALALQRAFNPIAEAWAKLGHEVGLGIGIAQGDTTLGVIGFEQRWEYAAIGNVPNLAARLCGAAHAGEIILDAADRAGHRPHRRHRVRRRADAARLPAAGARLQAAAHARPAGSGQPDFLRRGKSGLPISPHPPSVLKRITTPRTWARAAASSASAPVPVDRGQSHAPSRRPANSAPRRHQTSVESMNRPATPARGARWPRAAPCDRITSAAAACAR